MENNDYLYKYLTFEQFVDLVENEKLYFTRITNWEDVYEGYYVNKFFEYALHNSKVKVSREFIKENIYMIKNSRYAQCWCMDKSESDAMWRIYSPNKTGVRIKVKKDDIKKCICNIDDFIDVDGNNKTQIHFINNTDDKVKYDEEIDFEKYYENGKGYKFHEIPFEFYKRCAFTHEKEYRFSIDMDIDFLLVKLQDENLFGLNKQQAINKLPIVIPYEFPNDKLAEVLLDPRAANYFEDTFNRYCTNRKFKERNIEYGKSQLYKLGNI